MMFFNISVFILASIFIIILAYFTTRFLSLNFTSKNNNKNIKFVEKFPLGVDKSLVLIQLDNNFYLIFINKNGAQLIDKIDSLKLNEPVSKPPSFSDIFFKIRNKK
ncbi:MAG: flagellar protein FliO/FliZ [Candidatus Petromonas sp.]|nr:flagellar protein FliO/FliZ [Candidatus Petromonas sp.]